MIIFIPTRNRQSQQFTAKSLVAAGVGNHYRIVYVVSKGDPHPTDPALDVLEVDAHSIGQVRRAIIRLSKDNKVCMMDDDLRFYFRDDLDFHDLTTATDVQIRNMVLWLDESLIEYAHVGISARTQNFQCSARLVKATVFQLETVRPYRIYCYDKSILVGEKLDFNAGLEVNTMDDFHMTLELLELGYPNLINFRMAQEQVWSNSKGGCSEYRDIELLRKCALNLKEKHPNFVKVVQKQTKCSWGGTPENPVTRTDVIIQWQKALGSRANESIL